jgi:hypothetical protein
MKFDNARQDYKNANFIFFFNFHTYKTVHDRLHDDRTNDVVQG